MEGAPNVYHHLPAYHRHHNLNRALLFRVPRHNQNVQHSQKNLGHNSGTSTSQGKTNPPSKFGYQPEPRSGYTGESDVNHNLSLDVILCHLKFCIGS